MQAYLAQLCDDNGSHARAVGGIADHVHILCDLTRSSSVADLVGKIKRTSSKWIKTQGKEFEAFAWQNGYGSFAVSHSHAGRVVTYIQEQERHHTAQSYQDEFRGLLARHDVDYDERYVWD
jgi:REP element-mobilizing transposase RayT